LKPLLREWTEKIDRAIVQSWGGCHFAFWVMLHPEQASIRSKLAKPKGGHDVNVFLVINKRGMPDLLIIRIVPDPSRGA
jgi:hypothetical protein